MPFTIYQGKYAASMNISQSTDRIVLINFLYLTITFEEKCAKESVVSECDFLMHIDSKIIHALSDVLRNHLIHLLYDLIFLEFSELFF